MSHHNKESLTRQVERTLTAKLVAGEKKHAAKEQARAEARARGETGPVRLQGIYSYTTLKGYLDKAVRFVKWAQNQYGCRTLADCRQHTAEYLQSCQSASTAKAVRSALAKLYGCSGDELGAVPTRHRADITRSRGERAMDKHFSESKNADLVAFCRSTGLRRSELRSLRGDDLVSRQGTLYIHVRSGKGGRERYAPVLHEGRDVVERLCRQSGHEKVFGRIHSAADIHSYRADYATALYHQHARTLEECQNSRFWNPQHYNGPGQPSGGYETAVYWCRGDRQGEWMDKQAMLTASEALGHSRISVVGEHYIRF